MGPIVIIQNIKNEGVTMSTNCKLSKEYKLANDKNQSKLLEE